MNFEFAPLTFLAATLLLTPVLSVAALQKPRWLLWAYLINSTLFPKFIYLRISDMQYPAANAFNGVVATFLVLAALHHGRTFTGLHRRTGIRTLFVLLCATYAVTTLGPLALNAAGIGNPLMVPLSTKANAASLVAIEYAAAFAGLVFLSSAAAATQLIRVVIALAICGAAESLVFYYFQLLPQLEPLAINRFGQLDGLLFGSPDGLARITALASLGALYLASSGSKAWLAVLPFFGLSLVATQNRATAVSLVAGIAAYSVLRGGTTRRSAVLVTWLLVGACGAAAAGLGLVRALDEQLSTLRRDYKDPSNALARLVIAQRGVEVAWHTQPFGTGAGQAPYYMNSAEVPTLFGEAEYYTNRPLYYEIRSGSLLTSVHNLYLNFLIEGGVLAAVAMLQLIVVAKRTLRNAWRGREFTRDTPLDAILAMLTTIAVNVAADSTFRPYALYLSLLWCAAMLAYPKRRLYTTFVSAGVNAVEEAAR